MYFNQSDWMINVTKLDNGSKACYICLTVHEPKRFGRISPYQYIILNYDNVITRTVTGLADDWTITGHNDK